MQRSFNRQLNRYDICCVKSCICITHFFIFVIQVYQVLEEKFRDCPWPVPPSAILLNLPVQERKEQGLTSEAILRRVIGADKRQRHCFPWTIRNVHVRPDKTVFDDGTDARIKPQRHYAFNSTRDPVVSENKWATFLNFWSASDLGTATNLLCAHVCADLTSREHELLSHLRKFHDVLLLQEDDPLCAYQTRLRSLHQMGMLNLSLPKQDGLLSKMFAEKRSLVARLREANKRNTRHESTIDAKTRELNEVKERMAEQERLLEQAQVQMQQFMSSHPDWNPEVVDLTSPENDDLHDDARKVFEQVDRDLDVRQQMKHDPSGVLATFWAEQRKQLSSDNPKGRRWNQQVLMHCFLVLNLTLSLLTLLALTLANRFYDTAFFYGCP